MTVYVDWESKQILPESNRTEWIAQEADQIFWCDSKRDIALENYLAVIWSMRPETIQTLSDQTRSMFAAEPSFENWVDCLAESHFSEKFQKAVIPE